jgi:folate-dependent phosphoribosylglycinamide formyltransferase PurN
MRILIISDNHHIGKSILNIINSYDTKKCTATLTGSKSVDMKSGIAIAEIIKNHDLVISAHCKKIFPRELTENIECINIHPGFNPYNRGWFPQVFSINNGLPVGATVHIIDDLLDHGDIIIREQVEIDDIDTSLSLYNKIVEKEIEIFGKVLPSIIEGNIKSESPEIEGNVNYKSDFNNLCELDMGSIGTLKEHIDLLRSLSHGEYDNAYFVNDIGDKIYVKINLKRHA